jgi:hypothetical protein
MLLIDFFDSDFIIVQLAIVIYPFHRHLYFEFRSESQVPSPSVVAMPVFHTDYIFYLPTSHHFL